MGVVINMLKKAYGANLLFLISSLAIVLYSGNVWHIGLFFVAIYLFVAYSNECRGSENIWIFMLVAIGFIPINVALEMRFHEYISLLAGGIFGRLLSFVMIYVVLFSIEEIFAGLIGRIIWRRQKFDE